MTVNFLPKEQKILTANYANYKISEIPKIRVISGPVFFDLAFPGWGFEFNRNNRFWICVITNWLLYFQQLVNSFLQVSNFKLDFCRINYYFLLLKHQNFLLLRATDFSPWNTILQIGVSIIVFVYLSLIYI